MSEIKILPQTNYFNEIIIYLVPLLVIWSIYKSFRKSTLPPGPWGLPFVGYLPFLVAETHTQFWELSKKYGPVFGLTIGSRYVVVINDIDCMLETYRKDGVNSRPSQSFHMFSEFDSIADMNDAPWKEHRKFFVVFLNRLLKTEGGVSNLHNILKEETDILLEKLEKLKNKLMVNVKEVFTECITNVPLKYIMDIRLPDGHPFVSAMAVQQSILLNQGTVQDLICCFPEWRWLLRLILPSQRILKKATKSVEAFIYEEIARHKQALDPDSPRDYMDLYLLHQEQERNEVAYSDGILNSNVQIIMGGASDTTIISTSWLFLLLATYPEIQEKIFREIVDVFGSDQKPEWSEHGRLPYTMASIYEGQRFKTLVPMSTIRSTSKDIKVKDVVIPKDTILVSNLWAIHNDVRYWGDPANFRPERFLTADGTFNSDKSFVAFSFENGIVPPNPWPS